MAEIVNLRRARKHKAREEKAAKAEVNRRRHGRAKAEVVEARFERDTSKRGLDNKKLD